MKTLLEKLENISKRIDAKERPTIDAAIDRIRKLEEKLNEYEDDITDWKFSVVKQMKREGDDK